MTAAVSVASTAADFWFGNPVYIDMADSAHSEHTHYGECTYWTV